MTFYQKLLSLFWPKHLCWDERSHQFRTMLVKEDAKWGCYVYTADVCVRCGRIDKSNSRGMC